MAESSDDRAAIAEAMKRKYEAGEGTPEQRALLEAMARQGAFGPMPAPQAETPPRPRAGALETYWCGETLAPETRTPEALAAPDAAPGLLGAEGRQGHRGQRGSQPWRPLGTSYSS